jgi:hypothetical protein
MLLSIAVITIIAGISIPIYQTFQVRNDLDLSASTIAQTARRAQFLAQASDGDSNWSVHVASGSIVLYKGSAFAARDLSVDETFDLPKSLTPTGASDITYQKFTGMPQATGTILLTSNANETRTILINAKGMVSY